MRNADGVKRLSDKAMAEWRAPAWLKFTQKLWELPASVLSFFVN